MGTVTTRVVITFYTTKARVIYAGTDKDCTHIAQVSTYYLLQSLLSQPATKSAQAYLWTKRGNI